MKDSLGESALELFKERSVFCKLSNKKLFVYTVFTEIYFTATKIGNQPD